MCSEVAKYQVKPNEACNVSFKYNTCYCYDFDVNYWEATSDVRRNPIEYCEGIQGVNIKTGIGEIHPKFLAMQRLRSESCQ